MNRGTHFSQSQHARKRCDAPPPRFPFRKTSCKFKPEPETFLGMGLAPGAARLACALLNLKNPSLADLEIWLKAAGVPAFLTSTEAGRALKRFAIENGLLRKDLYDLGMRTIAFKRAAALTGKPRPELPDLLGWCRTRQSVPSDFRPTPTSIDGEIERFATANGHQNTALMYLGLGLHAEKILTQVTGKHVPGILDLRGIVEAHPQKSERGNWLLSQWKCGEKAIWDIEDVIQKHLGGKQAPV